MQCQGYVYSQFRLVHSMRESLATLMNPGWSFQDWWFGCNTIVPKRRVICHVWRHDKRK